jgi:hypothetical protein
MFRRPFIQLDPPRLEGTRVTFPFSCSPRLRKYFRETALRVAYDVDVRGVPPSILAIPVVANVVSVAWAAGADLHVDRLDATFAAALDDLRRAFKAWYPKLALDTEVRCAERVANRFDPHGYGLLFSGGVDSTTSYIAHRAQRPTLFMVWGTNPPWAVKRHWRIDEDAFWARIQARYRRFADAEGVPIHFLTTNMRYFVDEARLNQDFRYDLYAGRGNWWIDLHHGLALLGLCAPLTQVKRLDTLLISSNGDTAEVARTRPYGTRSWNCNAVRWADVRARLSGSPLTRQEKIRRFLKPFVNDLGKAPFLNICWNHDAQTQFVEINCGRCEKCQRTIAGLLLDGVDPTRLGFRIDDDFFDHLRARLPQYTATNLSDWQVLQAAIPASLDHDLHGSRSFFAWLRGQALRNDAAPHPVVRATPVFLRRHVPEAIKRRIRRYLLREPSRVPAADRVAPSA